MKKKTPVRGLTVFFLLCISFAAIIGSRLVLSAAASSFERLRDSYIALLCEKTGLDISYKALSPSLLSGIRMSDITVSDIESSAVILKIRSVKLTWNLFKLLTGKIAEVPEELLISGVYSDYDDFTQYALRGRLLSFFAAGQSGQAAAQTAEQGDDIVTILQSASSALLSLPIQVRIKNVSLTYTDIYVKNELQISMLKMSRSKDMNFLQWTLSGKNIIGDVRKTKSSLGTLAVGFSAQASFTPDLENSFARLRLFSLKNSDYSIPALNMYASYTGNTVHLSLMQNMLPFSLTASADAAEKSVSVRLSALNLNLFDLFKVNKKNTVIRSIDSCFISGDYSLLWNKRSNGLNYQAEGSVNAKLRGSGKSDVSFKITGDLSSADIRFIDIESSVVSASYSGTFDIKNLRPQGSARLRSLRLPNGNNISAEVYMESFANESLIFIPQLYLGENTLTAAQLRLIGSGASRDFTFEVYDYSKAETAGPAALKLNGSFSLDNQTYIQAQLSAENVFADSAASVAAWFLPEKQAGFLYPLMPALRPYIFSFDVFFSSDLKSITYNAPYAVIANTKKDNEMLLLSLNGTEAVFQLSSFNMLVAGQSVQLEAGIDTAAAGDEIFFSASLFINSIPYAFSGVFAPAGFLNITGDYNFNASFAADKKNGITGSIEASSVPLAVNNLLFSYSLSLRGEYYPDEDWNIHIEHIECAEISKNLRVSPRFRFSGFADSGGVYLNDASYSDELSSLNGNINILWNTQNSIFESLSLNAALSDSFSSEKYSVTAQVYNPELFTGRERDFIEHLYFSAEAEVRDLPSARFFNLQREDNTINGRLTALGTMKNLSVQLTVDKASFAAGTAQMSATGSVMLEDNMLSLADCNIQYGVLNFSALNGTVSLTDFSGTLTGSLNGKVSDEIYFNKKTFTSPFSLTMHSLDDNASVPFKEKSFQADLVFSYLEGSFFNPRENYTIRLIRTPGRFNFYIGADKNVHGTFSDSGELELRAEGDFPVRFYAQGMVQKGELFVFVDDIAADGEVFAGLLDLPVFSLYSGTAVGQGTITGNFSNPVINAEFRGTNMRIGVPDYIDEKMLCTDLQVKAVNNVFSASGSVFVGEKSSAQVSLDAEFILQKMQMESVSLHVKTLGTSRAAARYRMPYGTFTGSAQADITLFVDKESVDVRGTVAAEDLEAIIMLTPDENIPVQSVNTDIGVDLTITTDAKSRLFIPSKRNPLVRGIAVQTEPLRVHIDTRFGTSSFTGAFTMKGGEVLYLNRTFYVREASVVLNETMENFDPHLSARAEIRERDALGDPIRIILSIVNQPLSRLNPVFSSIPVKSQQEIMTLLGRILLADSGSGGANPLALIGGLADYGAQITVFRTVENRLRDLFKFDIFSLRTTLLQNAFMNALNVNTGQKLTVGNFLDNTTVYIGKYFGDTIYADAMLHLAYNEKLAKTDNLTGGLVFQPEIGLELPSPFGTIRWSIAPELNSDWKLLVPHTSIGISWKFNF